MISDIRMQSSMRAGIRPRQPGASNGSSIDIIFAFALLLLTSPLDSLITGIGGVNSATSFYSVVRAIVAGFAIIHATKRYASTIKFAAHAWPLLLFTAYACLSLAWSSYFQDASRNLTFFLFSIAFGLAMFGALSVRHIIASVIGFLALALVGSVLAATLMPTYGVVSASDAVWYQQAGLWKGLYRHKNELAHITAIAFPTLIVLGRRYLPLPIWGLTITAALACFAMTRSGSAIAIVIITLSAYGILFKLSGVPRIFAIALMIALAIPLTSNADFISDAILQALGKSSTLSGRTQIWSFILGQAAHNPLLGNGFAFTLTPAFQLPLMAAFNVNHVHNAYLDCFITYGAFGIVLIGICLSVSVLRATKTSRLRPPHDLLVLSSLILVGCMLSGLSETLSVRPAGSISILSVIAWLGFCRVSFKQL